MNKFTKEDILKILNETRESEGLKNYPYKTVLDKFEEIFLKYCSKESITIPTINLGKELGNLQHYSNRLTGMALSNSTVDEMREFLIN